MKNFFRRICYCLCNKSGTIPLVEEGEEKFGTGIQKLSQSASEEELFDKKWYREDEKEKIKYTKKSIIQLIENEFDPELSKDKYKEFFNKNGLVFSCNNNGSVLTEKFPLIRMNTFLSKKDLPKEINLNQLVEYMTGPSKRPKWDTGFNEYKLIEGSDSCGILYSWMKSPVFFVSERDGVDKKVDFYENKEFFSFSSSVPDEFLPIKENVVRITDYIFLYHIYEDQENFYIQSLTQMDFKMNLPQNLLNVTLPFKMQNWYKSMIAYMKKEHEQVNNKGV